MRLKITKTNHSNIIINDWLFMLSDGNGEMYYIMNDAFYERRNMKCPVSPKEMESYYNGLCITAHVKQLGNKNVVVSF